jgi:sugar O-acyltransferase (sialic acid O-acetyltransferase NeuD family)
VTGERVIIFGTGRGADTAYRYLSKDSPHEICGFAVDGSFVTQSSFHGLPVVEYEAVVSRFPPDVYRMFVPLGFQRMNGVRAERYLHAKALGYRFISYVNSRHYAVEGMAVGENCFILDSQIVNLDVAIGNNVTMWSGNHIGDRTVIGDHVWISSHVTLSGDVTVGDSCFLGVNASVSNRVRLGARTFVGAGALVTRDTPPDSVWVAPPSTRVQMPSEKFLSMLNIT